MAQSANVNLGIFGTFTRTVPSHKEGPQARDCQTAARHFLACGPLYGVLRHINVHLVQRYVYGTGYGSKMREIEC